MGCAGCVIWLCTEWAIEVDEAGKRVSVNVGSGIAIGVVVLGGSSVWGDCVGDEFTVPSYFAKKGDGKYFVENYGERGYNAYQDYQCFQIQVLKGERPALVIAYDGVNNSPASLSEPYTHSKQMEMNSRLTRDDDNTYFLDFSNFLRPTFTLLNKVKNKVMPPDYQIPEHMDIDDQRNIEAARELLASWMLMKKIYDDIGCTFVCSLQPNATYGDPNFDNLMSSEKVREALVPGYHYYNDVLRLIQTKEYSELEKHFLDLSNALDQRPNVYVDLCHLFPAGNDLLAQSLLDFVEEIESVNDGG